MASINWPFRDVSYNHLMKIYCMSDTSFYYKQFDGIWSSTIVFRRVLHFLKYSKCVKRSIVYDILFHGIKNFCKLAKWIQNGTMFSINLIISCIEHRVGWFMKPRFFRLSDICPFWEDLIICLLHFTDPRWTDPGMTSNMGPIVWDFKIGHD